MSHEYSIVREAPWPHVPRSLQKIHRTNRFYYLLTIWLRNNPPNEKTYTLRQLSEEFDVSVGYIRFIVCDYRLDGKIFLKYIPKPKGIDGAEQEWKWAIDQLHKQGFFLVNPVQYLSPSWGEPTLRQFEDYTTRYYREAVHRAVYRLRDAIDYSLQIDGIDIRKELGEELRKKALIESCGGCKHSYRCIPPSGFKCPWGKKYTGEEESEALPPGMTEEDIRRLFEDYHKRQES